MKAHYLCLVLLGISLPAHSQNVPAMEHMLSAIPVNNMEAVRAFTDAIFRIDPFNTAATSHRITSFQYVEYGADSAEAFFARLEQAYPERAEPKLLRIQFPYGERSRYRRDPRDTSMLGRIRPLLEIHSNSAAVHLALAYEYYPYWQECQTNSSGHACRYHFMRAAGLKPELASSLQFPIAQLGHFLRNASQPVPPFQDDSAAATGMGHFALADLFELPENWESDYSFSLLRPMWLADHSQEWYSRHLRALQEPVMRKQTGTSYRFLWLRTFHHPVSIRVEHTPDGNRIYWKMSNGAGGYGPGKLIVDTSRLLMQGEWAQFNEQLRAADFWTMPTHERERSGWAVADGAQWIVEGVDGGRYHMVDRHSSRARGSEYRQLCEFLIGLTNLRFRKKELY